jgi:hypothetical protein
MHKGSRGIIVGAVETLGGKRKSGWNSGTIKIDRFLSFTPPTLNANVLFLQVFFLISPRVWPNSGYWCCLFLKNISNIWEVFAPFKYETSGRRSSKTLNLNRYIISLVCPVVVVLSIHPSRHPSIQVPHPGRWRWWKRRRRKNSCSLAG